MTSHRLARVAVPWAVLVVVACSPNPRYIINQPTGSIVCTDPAGLACNVPVNVQWDGVSVRSHPETTLDGAPITLSFSASGKSDVATLFTGVGAHTFGVSGDLAAKGTIGTYSATSSFTLTPKPTPTGSFAMSMNPSAIVVERGKSNTATLTVTRSAPFTGAVAVTSSALPTGVTATVAPAPVTGTSATVTVSATAGAATGATTLTLTGTATGIPSTTASLAITIGRETGAFQEASPTPYSSTLPSSVNALAGGFRVDISNGAPSLPQPRKAQFFRGTQTVGNEIGFTLGPNSSLGGAGFCNNTSPAAIARGVVLSGALPGFASQNVAMILNLTINAPPLVQIPADMTVQQSSGALVTFQPRVFFSPDCTLALVAGANKLGPSKHILRVFDLATGNPIGSEVSFETATFSALVRNATTAGKQEVVVTVDTGTSTAQTVLIAVP